ncbi:stAR-related lipid transfer protein 7, mitochondrial-like [Glandiceps talaboti]
MVLQVVGRLSRNVIINHHFPHKCVINSRNITQFRPTAFQERFVTLQAMLRTRVSSSVNTVIRLFGLQVNSVTAQRIRRIGQLVHMYNTYAEKSVQSIAATLARRYLRGGRHQLLLFAGALFAWDRERVSEQELESCVDDLYQVRLLLSLSNDNEVDSNGNTTACLNNGNHSEPSDNEESAWEQLIGKEHLKMWRKPIPNSHLYKYTVYGTFEDITAKDFFLVQLDVEYRKVWDKLVIKLDVIDKDEDSDCEVVHWVMHYPFPMYSREYVFIRKQKIDYKNNTMTLLSRAVSHPKVPENNKYVRVNTYHSQMVIKPHKNFDQNGFEYVLTYFDDPQTHFPSRCVSYLTSAGIPDYVTKLHCAAMELKNNPNINYKIKSFQFSDSGSSKSDGISSMSNLV